MESGTLSSWGIAVGDEIIEGETAIAEIETDKAVVTFEATGIEGYVAKIFRAEGDKDIKLGEPLFIVVEEKEDVAKFADFTIADASGAGAAPAAAPAAAAAAPVAAATAVAAGAAAASGDRVFISPLAKKIAGEQGINVNQLAGTGTGPKGRVVAADVKNFTPAAAAAAPVPVAAESAPAASVASTGEYTAIDVT
jgi:pyruvate dehydrogenase E2 component (dihydrolipoamide acetyltransferase)